MTRKTRNETAAQIDAAAADWAARMDRGLSVDEQSALDDWLAADARRAGAFARARALALYTERARALGEGFDPQEFVQDETPPSPSRRRFLWGATATAAGATGLVFGGLAYGTRGEAHVTRRGEMRVVPLADGSVVSLNTDTRIRVLYGNDRRLVYLERGEALFDVAKDAQRPFVVHVDDAQVRAVGTSFTVQKFVHAPMEVMVREGVVEIERPTAQTIRLMANMHAVAPADNAGGSEDMVIKTARLAHEDVERALAWREGRIAFQGETLAEAAMQFQRYSDIRIVFADPAIADERITGLFQANDPVGFARAVATSFDLKADVGENQIRLHR